ncbi:hypothetical protein R6Q57_023315 [Mikania cordata]
MWDKVKEIYMLGVRRIVVFSTPPIGCLPAVRTLAEGIQRTCVDKDNNLAQFFNNMLKQELEYSTTSFPQLRVAFVDYYNPFADIIESPHKYGFDVTDVGCCGTGELEASYLCNKRTVTCTNRSKYFFWDNLHPTERGYEIIMNSIIQDIVILIYVYCNVYLCISNGIIIPQKNIFVSALFVFGDSFVDQGNNNYINALAKANFFPYGKDFLGKIPTGRFSNGKTLSDFIADALGVKDYLPASLDPSINDKERQTGVSFASAGSGFDQLTTTETYAISMSSQLDMFKANIRKLEGNIGAKNANNVITNSVVVVVAGNNDLLLAFPLRRLQYDVSAYSNMLVKLVLNFTQEIYTLGVRRIVVFSAPPIGCLPAVRTLAGGPQRTCVDTENNLAQFFNNILRQELQFWTTSLPQSRVAFIEYYNTLINIVENPHKYGFDVTDIGCCGTGEIETSYLCNKLTATCTNHSKYFFWDGFHMSEKGYEIIVNLIIQDLRILTCDDTRSSFPPLYSILLRSPNQFSSDPLLICMQIQRLNKTIEELAKEKESEKAEKEKEKTEKEAMLEIMASIESLLKVVTKKLSSSS